MSAAVIYTIGHGNRTLDEFISLLRKQAVKSLVDVRAQPYSSRFPYFSMEPLREAMESVDIVYHWAGRQLGGHRAAIADSKHHALEGGMRAYADYMETEAFHRAAGQLINMASRSSTAIMCAERKPENCHRRLIADYLILQGIDVVHLIEQGESHAHHLSVEARRESAQLIYDRNTSAELGLSG